MMALCSRIFIGLVNYSCFTNILGKASCLSLGSKTIIPQSQ